MKKLLFIFLIISLNSIANAQLNSLGSYVWNASDEAKNFNNKLQLSFVRSDDGFPTYGTVVAGGGYSTIQDGGAFQLYFPYSETYGGIAPKIRMGRYNNQGWSNWETFYTSANANKSTIDWAANNLTVATKLGIGTSSPNGTLTLKDGSQELNFLINKKLTGAWPANNENTTMTIQSTGSSVGNLAFATGNSERMRISSNGNLGIGTETPYNPISVQKPSGGNGYGGTDGKGGIRVCWSTGYGVSLDAWDGSSPKWGITKFTGNTPTVIIQGSYSSNNVIFNAGNVGIGTTSPTSLLTVAGKIESREVEVKINAGADFVFSDNYPIKKIEDVETFIKENKHLPEIPSAKEMETNGIELGEMNIKLLQKIEELTLYLIEQNKKTKEQSEKIKVLEGENAEIKAMALKLLELEGKIEKLEKMTNTTK